MNKNKTISVPVLILLMVISLYVSCDEYKERDVKQITIQYSEKTLTPTRIVELSENNLLLNPLRIINLKDEYLIISEMRQEDIFKVYALPELNFLYSWGSIGRGPDQLISMPYYLEYDDEYLIAYEGMKRELVYFQVSDTAFSNVDQSSLFYENQMDPLNRIRRVNDTLYYADYGTSFEETEYEHVALKPNMDSPLYFFGKYPETNLEPISRYSEYSKSSVSDEEIEKFATFYSKYNRFKIYSTDQGKLLRDVRITDESISNMDRDNPDYLYRTAAWASPYYMYTLGYNGTRDDIFENMDTDFQTILVVWDWEGNSVNRVKFDRLIHNFTVSEKHGKIYAFSYLYEDKLFEYNLDDALNN